MTISRHKMLGLALGATLGLASTAQAADMTRSDGIRRTTAVPAAVPVPVPTPVPDIASGWYFRLDAAYSMSDTSRYKDNIASVDALRSDSGLDKFGRYGLGVGYHFNRWLRADITFDGRTEVRGKGQGAVEYNVLDATGSSIRMRDTVFDRTRTKNWTGLINGYVDLPARYGLTPYVGAGIGWVMHVSPGRQLSLTSTCIDAVDCDRSATVNRLSTSLNTQLNTNGSSQNNMQMAAALMAGVSYSLSTWSKVDFGYRLLHLDGTTFTTLPASGTTNGSAVRMTIPDQNIHEIRIGWRYDVN